MVFEFSEGSLDSSFQEVRHLGEGLHHKSRLQFLAVEVGRKSVDIVIPILIVTKPELADTSVVDDARAGEYVVAVPVEPSKYISRGRDRP